MAKRGRKRIYKNIEERNKAYAKKSWYKAFKLNQRLQAVKIQLEKYRKLEKELAIKLRKYK